MPDITPDACTCDGKCLTCRDAVGFDDDTLCPDCPVHNQIAPERDLRVPVGVPAEKPRRCEVSTISEERRDHKWTERDLLDRIWRRYGTVKGLGDAPRYLVAEHPRTAMGDRSNPRVVDAIVLDRHRTYGDWSVWCNPPVKPPVASDGTPLAPHPVLGFEVKVSRGDWLRELKDPSKSLAWKRYCSEFYVVAPRGVVRPEELPQGWGLMADRGSGLTITAKPTITRNPEPMPQPVVAALMWAAIRTDRAQRGAK